MRKLFDRIRNSNESTKIKIVWIGTACAMILILIAWAFFASIMKTYFPKPEKQTSDYEAIDLKSTFESIREPLGQFDDLMSQFQTSNNQQRTPMTEEEFLHELNTLKESGSISEKEYHELIQEYNELIKMSGDSTHSSKTQTDSGLENSPEIE